ncbi:SDR family NAD(P)-dependent oxidoreductase [Tumidithrix helvetica PCC 7403]|uniref:SDR family NAD(P)-dependent oxidoreductase n=1 Tax=Tumidithrix helvetica TaxID=3457545 RepID=UPI003CC328FD
MKIKGKTALITGASRGIGKAIALELANQGVSCLLLLARNAQALADLAAEIEELNVQAIPLAVDLTKVEALSTTISQAWRDYGPIHLLVNCAGIAHQAPFLQSKLKNVQEEINVNLMGLYTVTRLVARRMASQQEGVIVNVSSLMGKLAAPTMSTYSATKFAILGFTQALRGELANRNVRVLALLPSLTDTDMVRQMQLFRWVVPSTTKQVAEALVKGVLSESPEIFVDWQSRIAAIAHRIVPWLMERVIQTAAPVYEPSR